MSVYTSFFDVSGSTNTVQAGVQSTTTTTVPDGSSHAESDLDSMYLLLDPHLRPATPDMDDPKSVALFEEHKQLAQDFLKVSEMFEFRASVMSLYCLGTNRIGPVVAKEGPTAGATDCGTTEADAADRKAPK